MLNNLNYILNDLDEQTESSEKFYLNYLSDELNNSELLIPNYHDNNLLGEFKDNTWILLDELSKTYILLDFKKFLPFKFLGLSTIDINRIKTFLAYLLITDELIPSTLKKMFSDIFKFIEITDNLNMDTSGLLEVLLEEKERLKSGTSIPQTMLKFLNFLTIKLSLYEEKILEYKKALEVILESNIFKLKQNSRILPKSKDIMEFHYCIDKFFNDSSIDEELKLYFMPIQIWWKLSNVIPLRISELTTKLSFDALNFKDGKYYLKIVRVKNVSDTRFPTLDEIELNEPIAKLLISYQNKTKKFGASKTFFSYSVLEDLRLSLNKKNISVLKSSGKLDENYFTPGVFSSLLQSFYTIVLENIYNTHSKHALTPGDTRHFAFFSLLIQGLSPVEIALLGGHHTLDMQVNYQNCIEYYIGTELYKFLNTKSESKLSQLYENLNTIFKKLPPICPKPLTQRLPLKIGYCLCDFSQNICPENIDFCCFCTNWWAEPTHSIYNLIKEDIKETITATEKDLLLKLTSVEEYICRKYILENPNITKLDNFITTINEIKNSCDKIIGLKIAALSEEVAKKYIL